MRLDQRNHEAERIFLAHVFADKGNFMRPGRITYATGVESFDHIKREGFGRFYMNLSGEANSIAERA
jgi:hypothetical protein